MADEQAQELPGAQATDSSDVAEKFISNEFTRVNQEKEPIEKLADQIASKPELSEPESQEELPKEETQGSSKQEQVPPTKDTFNYEKWDGKIESLPEKVQKIVKDNQAMATTKAQEAAQLRQQIELLTAKKETANDRPLFTAEEYEEAQLNPNKFTELVNKIAARAVEAKAAELMPVISKVQQTQLIAENEKMINDFATKNPDFWELYETGVMLPLIQQTKSIEQAYNLVKQFQAAQVQKTKQEEQVRVKEKKNASTFGRTSKHTENVMYIDGSKEEVLAKQIELTMQGKNIQVKQKK